MHNIHKIGRLSIPHKARSVLEPSSDVAKEWEDWIANLVGLIVDRGPKHRTATQSTTRTVRMITVSDNSLFIGIDGSCRKAIKRGRPEPSPLAVDTVNKVGTEGESNV